MGRGSKTEEQTATEMAAVLAEAEVDWDQVTFIPFGESMMATINNEPLTTSITATKQWLDMNGEPISRGGTAGEYYTYSLSAF